MQIIHDEVLEELGFAVARAADNVCMFKPDFGRNRDWHREGEETFKQGFVGVEAAHFTERHIGPFNRKLDFALAAMAFHPRYARRQAKPPISRRPERLEQPRFLQIRRAYPFAAPPGYRDNGKGALKTIDPVQGSLVRETFEKYASGAFGLHALRAHMNERGLRNSKGRPVQVSGLATMLQNPFYYGLLIVKGQSFLGVHEPLISKQLFDHCRARAEGRLVSATRVWGKAEYRFRQLVKCSACSRRLIAETQRGHVYYRCHSKACKGTCVREELIEEGINLPLSYLPTPPVLDIFLREAFLDAQKTARSDNEQRQSALALQLGNITAREQKLTDLYIDGSIESFDYQARRQSLHNERIDVQSEISAGANLEQNDAKVEQFIEHAKALGNMAQTQSTHEIRHILKSATSNISVFGKHVEIQWSGAFQLLIDVGGFPSSALDRQANRTCMHSVTDRDEPQNHDIAPHLREGGNMSQCAPRREDSRTCMHSVTVSDEIFKARMRERAHELYQAIIEDENLDNLRRVVANDNECKKLYPNSRHQAG